MYVLIFQLYHNDILMVIEIPVGDVYCMYINLMCYILCSVANSNTSTPHLPRMIADHKAQCMSPEPFCDLMDFFILSFMVCICHVMK